MTAEQTTPSALFSEINSGYFYLLRNCLRQRSVAIISHCRRACPYRVLPIAFSLMCLIRRKCDDVFFRGSAD
jgi:hypothetical protein